MDIRALLLALLIGCGKVDGLAGGSGGGALVGVKMFSVTNGYECDDALARLLYMLSGCGTAGGGGPRRFSRTVGICAACSADLRMWAFEMQGAGVGSRKWRCWYAGQGKL
ncbi:hypothetical protein B0H21DRAFT_221620 [Amylocystis lapponica]|nr:hypothetical protein B0H21DRAFT_221620 [Amylocystis lapponica]